MTQRKKYKFFFGILLMIYVTLLLLLKYNETLVGYFCALDFMLMSYTGVKYFITGLPNKTPN